MGTNSLHITIKRDFRENKSGLWQWVVILVVFEGGIIMTRIISITIAIIIMLTAGVNTEMIVAAKPTYMITATVKAKSSSHKNKKKNHKHKHCMPKGNIGKWFKSKKALKKHAAKVMKHWAELEENGVITREEYYEKCPSGYEAWSCSCGKWTGNFKYH